MVNKTEVAVFPRLVHTECIHLGAKSEKYLGTGIFYSLSDMSISDLLKSLIITPLTKPQYLQMESCQNL